MWVFVCSWVFGHELEAAAAAAMSFGAHGLGKGGRGVKGSAWPVQLCVYVFFAVVRHAHESNVCCKRTV